MLITMMALLMAQEPAEPATASNATANVAANATANMAANATANVAANATTTTTAGPWRAGFGIGGTPGIGVGVIAERRLDFGERAGTVFAGLTAQIGGQRNVLPHEGDAASLRQAYAGDLSVVVRKLFNPGDAVEVSMLIAVTGGIDHSEDPTLPDPGPASVDGLSLGSSLGLGLEHWFTPYVAVRASSSLLQFGAAYSHATFRGADVATDSTTFSGGLSLAPTVAAVVAF
jgi:hypothetical protein